MPAKAKPRESLRQEKWDNPEDPDCHVHAVHFDDGCPHLVGADEDREVQFADFAPETPLDRVIVH